MRDDKVGDPVGVRCGVHDGMNNQAAVSRVRSILPAHGSVTQIACFDFRCRMPIVQRPGKPRLHYSLDDYTDPWKNAPYLVLQHGNGRSSRFWYSWVPYLSRYYKVVSPDARGLSFIDFRIGPGAGVTVDTLVDDLAGICERSAHERYTSAANRWAASSVSHSLRRIRTGSDLTLVSTPVYISDKMKETYSMGHASRVDAMKDMGREAWLKATNRSTRFPPGKRSGTARLVQSRICEKQRGRATRLCKVVNGANAAGFLPGSRRRCSGFIRPKGRSRAPSRSDARREAPRFHESFICRRAITWFTTSHPLPARLHLLHFMCTRTTASPAMRHRRLRIGDATAGTGCAGLPQLAPCQSREGAVRGNCRDLCFTCTSARHCSTGARIRIEACASS